MPSAGEHSEQNRTWMRVARLALPPLVLRTIWENNMKLPHRRQFLHLAAGAASLPAASRIARAQAYPTRPVRIIVGFLLAAEQTSSPV